MMFWNSGCGCNSCNGCGWNNNMNSCRATPIVAPRKVCTSCSNQYVEQPIICPIECRHVNNVVYYPRYYPRYERTFMTQCNGNPYANAANATPAYDNSGINATDGESVINGMYNTTNSGGCGCGCKR
ncbi:hypothetical protein [Thomasclavelia cocleata]|uniref:hypothetical protein n=1 Tax=Thomasclavelia cocleata TaxID=69824 RepID=UPI00258C761C|nr:hypothetical protein [Thomasclavelia cocleata]